MKSALPRVCGAAIVAALLPPPAAADDWPQWRGPSRDGTWNETGLLERLPEGDLPRTWTAKIGAGYSGPTVANGRVYVTDRVIEPAELERVHCFDFETGKPVWSHEYAVRYDIGYDAGPRCAVLVHDGLAYSLGGVGHLRCFDAATGDVKWKRDLRDEYTIDMPIWGLAASPIIEDGLLIVPVSAKEDDACLVAFDAKTGEPKWKALGDRGNYAAPIIVEQAGRRVLVHWTGDRVVGLDPKTGSVHWSQPFAPKRMPLGCATPVVEGDRVFVTGFYDGSLMLRLETDELAAEELWRRKGPNERQTDGLQSIISTPLFRGDHVYGVDSHGELRCLNASDGSRVWEDTTAVPRARWATIHMVQNGARTWMFNERGELLIAELSPEGFRELSRAKVLNPTREQLNQRGGVCWSHPAFANRHVIARNDEELVCVDLSATD